MAVQQNQEVVQRLVKKLVAEYAPQKVILFGSWAYGSPHRDSDIDLLIIKETSDRFLDRWVKVRGILSDAGRNIPLETLVLTPTELEVRLRIGDQFIAEILEKGQTLYAG